MVHWSLQYCTALHCTRGSKYHQGNDTTAFDKFFFVNGDILSGVGIAVQQVSSNDMRLEIVRPAREAGSSITVVEF